MTYYISTQLEGSYEDALRLIKRTLSRHGFSIMTQIDMATFLRDELGVQMPGYLILGVCNPAMTYRALRAEDKIGTVLPFNIVLQEHPSGHIEISATDPVASMQAINNVVVEQVAQELRSKLQSIVDEIGKASTKAPG